MAVGWSRDGAVQEQIDASVADSVAQARSLLPRGQSAAHCQLCEEEIPAARRQAIPGVQLCIDCQRELEKEQAPASAYNRRGSKDSQLR